MTVYASGAGRCLRIKARDFLFRVFCRLLLQFRLLQFFAYLVLDVDFETPLLLRNVKRECQLVNLFIAILILDGRLVLSVLKANGRANRFRNLTRS